MPDMAGGREAGRIDWDSEWGEGDDATAGPPPSDTPQLEFRPIHAALPSMGEPVEVAGGHEGPDYEGAWLAEEEAEALGDIAGLRVLNAMAGTGEDAMALARMGAHVVVANLEEGAAREFALREGREIEFTDVHEQVLPEALRQGEFDVVYVGPDSLPWIENLDEWAWGLADALTPGGRLVIHDEHPLTYMFASMGNMLVVNTSYFGEALMAPDSKEDDQPLSLEREESWTEENPDRTNFGWTLGDLVTAFGDHGVATVRLEEMPSSERFFTALDALPDVSEDDLARVPGAFLLVAVKPPRAPA